MISLPKKSYWNTRGYLTKYLINIRFLNDMNNYEIWEKHKIYNIRNIV